MFTHSPPQRIIDVTQQMEEIAAAFSRHDFALTYTHMAEGICWDMVGGQRVVGKAPVQQKCVESKAYLSTISTTFTSFRVIAAADSVIIESAATYVDAGQPDSSVASCDIYRFVDGNLDEITSYNVELPGVRAAKP